jgi:hypothetical protein
LLEGTGAIPCGHHAAAAAEFLWFAVEKHLEDVLRRHDPFLFERV